MSELESSEIYRTVLESLQTGIYMVDREQKIVFWNEGAEKITGYLRHEVVGKFCRANLLGENTKGEMLEDAAGGIETVLRDGKHSIVEVSLRHKQGHLVPVRLRASAIRNSHGTIVGAVETFDESLSAGDWERRQGKLAGYGAIDAVTGVPTRGFIHSHLRESLATFSECRVPFSIMSVQVDDLDASRAKYGPAIVPEILRVVAQTLENALRPTDFMGRYSDNEFLLVLSECSAAELPAVAGRLRKMVSGSKVSWWGDQVGVTASFGGAAAEADDALEMLLERAKRALAKSLKSGGNGITVEAG